MLTKKSTVLNSAGFHLNEDSHVDFTMGPGFPPIVFPPTGNNDGVKMSPSVLYAKTPSFIFDNILEHPLNIELFSVSLSFKTKG